MYKIEFTSYAKEDLEYWKKNSPKMSEKIDKLIENIKKNPFTGIGKPEPLKYDLSGYWSRRINFKHRLVYKVHNKIVYIAQCKFHY